MSRREVWVCGALVVVLAFAITFIPSTTAQPSAPAFNHGIWEEILRETGATDPAEILSPRLFVTAYDLNMTTVFGNIWPGPTDVRPQPGPSGVIISLISTDADDTSGGTGAQVVRVNCIDTSGDIFEELVTMTGTVLTAPMGVECFRIQPSGVVQHGTSGGNEGEISFVSSDESPGLVYDIIPLSGDGSGAGGTSSGAYTVPAGHVAYVGSASWSAAVTDPQSEYTAMFKVLIPVVGYRSQTIPLSVSGTRLLGICYPGGTQFEILAAIESGGGQEMSASFSGRLVVRPGGQCG